MSEVIIGNQIWAGEDLSINDGGEGIIVRKYPILNGSGLGTVYYYNEIALNRISNNISGWHIPTTGEFITLFNNASYQYYNEACRVIMNPNTSLPIYYKYEPSTTIPLNIALAGDLFIKRLNDNSIGYVSSHYLTPNANGTVTTDGYTVLGKEARYWCSDRLNPGTHHYYTYLRPLVGGKKSGRFSASDEASNDVYMPIRLIKDS